MDLSISFLLPYAHLFILRSLIELRLKFKFPAFSVFLEFSQFGGFNAFPCPRRDVLGVR